MFYLFYTVLKLIILIYLLEPVTRFISQIRILLQLIFLGEPLDLKNKYGKWAVITGSTDGIGKAYAKELVKLDFNIVLISRNLEKLEVTRKELKEINAISEIRIVAADFSHGKVIYEQIRNELKDISVGILVNNVGMFNDRPLYLEQLSEKEVWDYTSINCCAATILSQMLLPEMKKRKRGAIVNVSSGTDAVAVPFLSIYGATKAYLRSLSDTIRLESSDSGITIQCLSPWFLKTNMTASVALFREANLLVPDAETYAESAIRTLGKLDSTSGYLYHEIQSMVVLGLPIWIRYRLVMIIAKFLQAKALKKDKYYLNN